MDQENSLYVKEKRIWQHCPFCLAIPQPEYIHGTYMCLVCKNTMSGCCDGNPDIRDFSGDELSTG